MCPTCCYYKRQVYAHGAVFQDECNTCWCYNGSVTCTKIACAASWTIEVTLHVFSGKPDPEYVIPRNTKSYDVILKAIGDTSTPLGERLGYNGFTVTLIRGDSEASRWTVGWCTRPVVELRILAAVSAMTPRGHQHPLQAGVIDYVKESILSCKG
ncbi:uncharacterized protein LOC127836099 [Dreissena polymorpha]|uniref:uncharacterized protein LOC127836099 n=1 Tax=Dreissena polymorpha TaxID=45954 RepID=UPI002263B1A8|nr:uncharacterized protein LOC127836099 [Dreissena polymorpha]